MLFDLFITFAKIGVMTFGGGYAMLPILQRELVENKGWSTEEDLADYYAIGQCTPHRNQYSHFRGYQAERNNWRHSCILGHGLPFPDHNYSYRHSIDHLFRAGDCKACLCRYKGRCSGADIQFSRQALQRSRERLLRPFCFPSYFPFSTIHFSFHSTPHRCICCSWNSD